MKTARIVMLAAALLAFTLLAGCDVTTKSESESDPQPSDTATPPAEEQEQDNADKGGSMLHVSPVQVTGTETAVMETSRGRVVLEFYAEDAPNHVASFIELADAGFYNGIKFHRVIPGFVAQGGDPQTRDMTSEQVAIGAPGLGTGDAGWKQKAEFNSRPHETGTLAMARAQHPDSAGSQFYICLAPQPQLDGQYTVFGRVIEGMDVVQSIEQGDTIESLTIVR